MHRAVVRMDRQEAVLTKHACLRMRSRHVASTAVAMALTYGRMVHVRGADIYALGRKEVSRCLRDGIDLSRWQGTLVVCAPDTGTVLTVYRNHNFRSLRPGRRRWPSLH